MSFEVTIDEKKYAATLKRKRNGEFDAVFREVGTRKTIVVSGKIRQKNGLVGGNNGFGPFGSPARSVKVYDIQGWGQEEGMTQRAFQYLADRINKTPL